MQFFPNPVGEGILFFDNLKSAEGANVVYDPERRLFLTDAHHCANRELIGCNWMTGTAGTLCYSCKMTTLSPDVSMPGATANWSVAEASKRWVLDNLGHWGWFSPGDTGVLPVFHMLAEGANPVVMGHAEGVVTISIEEADPVLRAGRQQALNERFRTMIGHMRHEIAHMLWWRLSVNFEFLENFRVLFGDERSDYSAALQRHYGEGPPQDWKERFLTSYASAHPHEDWAETAAHLLHLVDIADSFQATGSTLPEMPEPIWDPYEERDAKVIVNVAAKIALSVNHVNRSMGLDDVYPFVLSSASREKLEFVHKWLRPGPCL